MQVLQVGFIMQTKDSSGAKKESLEQTGLKYKKNWWQGRVFASISAKTWGEGTCTPCAPLFHRPYMYIVGAYLYGLF